jgi:UDP-N-acetylglucosamine 2-epimerase (non-hydrolysing)
MRILTVFGTRPEAIKMIPVVKALEKAKVDQIVCVTAQHRQMLDSVLEFFNVKPQIDLDIMQPGQTLSGLTTRILDKIDKVLADTNPDWVLVHGDTTTTMATALAAFYRRIPVGHVEAGLRSYNLDAPYPEELNRIVADSISQHHYVPTSVAAEALKREGRSESGIFVTGNTVVDVLLMTVDRLNSDRALTQSIDARFPMLDPSKRLILVTGHRRESFGSGFENICWALRDLAARKDVEVLYPVHLNPNVQKPVNEILSGLPNVHLVEPTDYPTFVRLMQRSHIILTDSGGIQEEAPSLDKPVLVMRQVTERAEAIATGAVRLVGVERASIRDNAAKLLDDAGDWTKMAKAANPFGDGTAGTRICSILLGKGNQPEI